MKKKRAKRPDTSPTPLAGRQIDAAMNAAAIDALRDHQKAGLPLAVWQDGQTVWIQPNQVDIPKGRKRPLRPRRLKGG